MVVIATVLLEFAEMTVVLWLGLGSGMAGFIVCRWIELHCAFTCTAFTEMLWCLR